MCQSEHLHPRASIPIYNRRLENDGDIYMQNQEISLLQDQEVNTCHTTSESHCTNGDETVDETDVWIPDVPEDFKPIDQSIWESIDDALRMYEKYAEQAGFVVRRWSQKKTKDGATSHRYFVCSKEGNPKKKCSIDTLEEGSAETDRQHRNSNYKKTGCKARIKLKKIPGSRCFRLYGFEEKHNHPLVDESNKHLTRTHRQLEFEDILFIHSVSTTNIGATKAHRLRACMNGGYDKVRGTVVEYKNTRRDINMFIGDRDAQMLVNKFLDRKVCHPEFSFDYKCENNELICLFWADETSICNYKEFGDVLSFDATYSTNKYSMVFVPFTGIDNHNKCVTFGAGLLKNEDIPSYSWLLEAFLKAHTKQPTLVLTDQDASMKSAVKTVMPESTHRLCMWHIMNKLPLKISSDILDNTDFRKRLHKLVWNVYIERTEFVKQWKSLIQEFKLQHNRWLSAMFKIRAYWIPAYFKYVPMSCLMKTTSRSESSNAFFRIFSQKSNTLVQFMLCFETAMEKQRAAQRALNEQTTATTPKMLTPLSIEGHACKVYTRTIFLKVQKEIIKGVWSCSQRLVSFEDGNNVYMVNHSEKRSQAHLVLKVVHNERDGSIVCSCNQYGRHGYLCRHIFCVLKSKYVDRIPEQYIMRRWRRDILPIDLLHARHRYGFINPEVGLLRNDAISKMELCLSRLRQDPEKLAEFVAKFTNIADETLACMPMPSRKDNKVQAFTEILGVTTPTQVDIYPPKGINNKGSRAHSGKRLANPGEKHVKKRKRQMRECKYCHEVQDKHDKRNCPIRLADLEAAALEEQELSIQSEEEE